ncbi:uncharacterized protein CDAR_61131 [Caerostris darwini]|uniref:Uncharacterized protein n=1 Tax=Caerostris darwini TaxID=1538125 RepID=A0AAV4UTH4_9ARAC|nr:uncharacterized protein CDAR_61131 [Caerostris darwini]
MRSDEVILILIYVFVQISYIATQVTAPAAAAATGSIPILIKDDGVKALHKEDVAMIFYITVTNTDVNDPIQLSASSKKCCFKVEKDEEDCESMKLVGGDMGKLVPTDIRNLTLIYANLYLHDRVGSCEIEIKSMKGGVKNHVVKYDTSLLRSGTARIPRHMENYYELEDVSSCSNPDENPLNDCIHYDCEIRYDGTRNYFDFEKKRCKVLAKCEPEKPGGDTSNIEPQEKKRAHQKKLFLILLPPVKKAGALFLRKGVGNDSAGALISLQLRPRRGGH